MNKIIDGIFTIVLIIALVVIIFGLITDLTISMKVIERDDCLKINGNYYCEVENDK